MNNFPNSNFSLNNNGNYDLIKLQQQLQSQKSTENSSVVNDATQNAANLVQNSQIQNSEIFFNQLNQNYMISQALKMTQEEVLKFLQTALEFPQTIEELIEEVVEKDTNEVVDKLKQLIDVKVINEVLKENSKSAIDKLLQNITIALKNGSGNVHQLKDLLGILNAINHSTNVETNTIRELLLLYIPLEMPVFDKQISFKKMFEGQEEKIKNASMSIMFTTINFANILCVLNCENNDILIEIYANSEFPFEKFNKIMSFVSKEIGLNIGVDFIKINSTLASSNQNFRIEAKTFIPVAVMLLANAIIKIIFNLDSNYQNL